MNTLNITQPETVKFEKSHHRRRTL